MGWIPEARIKWKMIEAQIEATELGAVRTSELPKSAPLDAGPDIDRHCGACRALRKVLQGAGSAVGQRLAGRRLLRDLMVPGARALPAPLESGADRDGGAHHHVHAGISATVASAISGMAAQLFPGADDFGLLLRLVGFPVLLRG